MGSSIGGPLIISRPYKSDTVYRKEERKRYTQFIEKKIERERERDGKGEGEGERGGRGEGITCMREELF